MSVSNARALLAQAAEEPNRVQRHLLVAAAMREVLGHEPIVVGGTAEDLYAGGVYVETDLDLVCPFPSQDEKALLFELGFELEGRHFFHSPSHVAVEFPGETLAGDQARVVRRPIGVGWFAVIGVDDLYLDRIRQATAYPDRRGSREFGSAFAVSLAAFEDIDWGYVEHKVKERGPDDPGGMLEIHKAVRRKTLAALRDPAEPGR